MQESEKEAEGDRGLGEAVKKAHRKDSRSLKNDVRRGRVRGGGRGRESEKKNLVPYRQ